MRDKENDITLPFEVVEEILTSEDQLVMIKKDGEWTGDTINKSEIITTYRDYDEEMRQNYNKNQIEEHQETLEEREKINKMTSELANKFKIPKK